MKCKNCATLLWRGFEREYLPNKKVSELYYYRHDWGAGGVYRTGKTGCTKPEPEASRGEQEKHNEEQVKKIRGGY
jgi:hypothetical protein